MGLRLGDDQQWKYLVGPDFEALRGEGLDSPKLRTPVLDYVFSGFREAYQLTSERFAGRGSLALGGLASAWGAGVACFDSVDLQEFPFPLADLLPSYRTIAARIGISGTGSDDLGSFFGTEIPLQPSPTLETLATTLLGRYQRRPHVARSHGITIGRSRNAVLTTDHHGREGCVYCGFCLHGCSYGSIYTPAHDLAQLVTRPNFTYQQNVFVERVGVTEGGCRVWGRRYEDGAPVEYSARAVFLACGAIGSGKLVLQALHLHDRDVPLLSLPQGAFALWFPERLGEATPPKFWGLTQLSFVFRQVPEVPNYAFGNIFSTSGLLRSEFIPYLPVGRRNALRILRLIMSSMLVGNVFLPGSLADNRMVVRQDGSLKISGGYKPELDAFIDLVRRRLASALWHYGGVVLPGSFKLSPPGSDMHYAGTVPHRARPLAHQCHPNGEVAGLPRIYVVDGAALSSLPAKAHTLTIMANADKIARAFVHR